MSAAEKLTPPPFPPELLTRQQWLIWRFVQKPGQKKPSKMPYYANGAVRTGQQGSEEDRNALVDYRSAVDAAHKLKADGLGFAFLPGDGLIGIDIDGALQDNADPVRRDRAMKIIQACNSYTEYSPSGHGVHIICNGQTETFKSNELGIEVFCGRQFFTMSGDKHFDSTDSINDISLDTLNKLRSIVKQQSTQPASQPRPQPAVSDSAKLEAALLFISPDCGYDDWIRIGMAIHAELGEAGFSVWNWWSARGSKYPGERELESHWRSFKPGAVTAGTIYHLAMENGWRAPKPVVISQQPSVPQATTPASNDNTPVTLPDIADSYALERNSKGEVYATIANITKIIQSDPALSRTIWFDEFLQRKMTCWRISEPREWSDVDDLNLQIYLQIAMKMPKLTKTVVQDSTDVVARADVRNEVKAYLEGLQWDGIERLPDFFQDCFGADDSEYTRAVGLNFWISMVARAMRPGCKVDNMIVLEGVQGAGKSSALGVIGGKWFTEAHRGPSEKDFFTELEGKLLIEIGEMDAFSRAEVNKVKQVITCQTDRYRSPYGKNAADHPRRCIFAGTTNRDDWNKDETGARRFWPIYCREANANLIAQNRDQYFAEALHRLNKGAKWWEMPMAATKAQQEARRDADELEGVIGEWLIGRTEVSVQQIMTELMHTPLDRQDKQLQMRIGKCLRAIGWTKNPNPVYRNGKNMRVWTKKGGETN